MDNLPKVSIVMPIKNEELFIRSCLNSVLANTYPHDKMEIIIVDGKSTDKTIDILADIAREYPFIKVAAKTARIHGDAMNIGIQEATGEIIVRMDAHTLYDSNYIAKCVDLLEKHAKDVVNVGGVQYSIGSNYVTEGVAQVVMSPFGVGNAYYRFSKEERFVDTVYLGAWKKESLQKVGGFNNQWTVNEDYELNYRLRREGGKILLSPEIKSQYFVRSSLYKLFRQYLRYGYGKARTIITYPQSLKLRQFLPPVFILCVLVSMVAMIYGKMWGWIIPMTYLLMDFICSLQLTLKTKPKYFPLFLIIFPIIHFSWGIGFLIGLPRFLIIRRTYLLAK